MKPFLILISGLCLFSTLACGMSGQRFAISFHSQAGDMDNPRSIFRWQLPGRSSPTVFKKVPEFTHKDIAAFHSFRSEDGQSNGVTLRLDFRGTSALEMVTRTRRGEVLLAMINGTPVDYLTIDKPVSDGIITIWEGVPETVIAEIKKKHPPIKELRSMSSGQEMLPTTRAEKKRALEEAEQRMKEEARKAKEDARKPAQPAEASSPRPQRTGMTCAPAGAGTGAGVGAGAGLGSGSAGRAAGELDRPVTSGRGVPV
jgi:hypothetical protein